jgi:hypothetical protein
MCFTLFKLGYYTSIDVNFRVLIFVCLHVDVTAH